MDNGTNRGGRLLGRCVPPARHKVVAQFKVPVGLRYSRLREEVFYDGSDVDAAADAFWRAGRSGAFRVGYYINGDLVLYSQQAG